MPTGVGVLCALTLLVPLVVAPGLLLYFDVTPKLVVFCIGMGVACLLFPPEAARNFLRVRFGRLFAGWLAGILLSLAVSTIFSTRIDLSLGGTVWRRFGLVAQVALLFYMFAVAAFATGWPSIRLVLIRWSSAGSLVVALLTFAQALGLHLWAASDAAVTPGAFRPASTLGSGAYLGIYLAIALFLSMAAAYTEEREGWRQVAWLSVFVGAGAVWLSGTRAAWIGTAAGMVVASSAFRRPGSKERSALRSALQMCGWMLFITVSAHAIRARLGEFFTDLSGGARLMLWRDALAMAVGRPWFGYGPEVFAGEFPRYASARLAATFPEHYHESAHNVFLDCLTSQGIFGLVLALGAVVVGVLAYRRAVRSEPRVARFLLAALVSAFVSHQFFVFTLPTACCALLPLALLAGIAAAGETGASKPEAGRVWLWRVFATGPALILFVFAWRLLATDFYLERARQALDAGNLSEAVESYTNSVRWRTPGGGSDAWFARRLAAAAETLRETRQFLPQISAAAERGNATAEDRHNAWYLSAALKLATGDTDGAREDIAECLRIAPQWEKAKQTQATILSGTGDARTRH